MWRERWLWLTLQRSAKCSHLLCIEKLHLRISDALYKLSLIKIV